MNWKELKPDWRKIVLVIMMAYIFDNICFSVEHMNDRECIANGPIPGMMLPDWSCNVGLVLLYILLKPFEGFLHYVMGYAFPQINIYLLTTATLPYYYFLSCLIVWGYDRYIKRKRRTQ